MGRTFTIRGTYRPKIRLPLPRQVGRPQTTKHGAKGYDRNKAKATVRREWA